MSDPEVKVDEGSQPSADTTCKALIDKYYPTFHKVIDNPESSSRQVKAIIQLIHGYILYNETCSAADAIRIKLSFYSTAEEILYKRYPDRLPFDDEACVPVAGDPDEETAFKLPDANDNSYQVWTMSAADAKRALSSVKSRNRELVRTLKTPREKIANGRLFGRYKGCIRIYRLI